MGRQCFIVVSERGDWIEREIELVAPAEIEACFRQCIIPPLRARVTFGEVGGVHGDAVVVEVKAEKILPIDFAQMQTYLTLLKHR